MQNVVLHLLDNFSTTIYQYTQIKNIWYWNIRNSKPLIRLNRNEYNGHELVGRNFHGWLPLMFLNWN